MYRDQQLYIFLHFRIILDHSSRTLHSKALQELLGVTVPRYTSLSIRLASAVTCVMVEKSAYIASIRLLCASLTSF